MKIALDSNRYTDLTRGDHEIVKITEEAEEVYLPFPVLGELRAGFALGRKGAENERIFQRFLMKPGVETLFAGDATTRNYAMLFRQLRRQGTPIPTNDIWIAALIVEHGLALCSRDQHFRHLPQLNIL